MRQRPMGSKFTIEKSDEVRVHDEKKSNGVRVDNKKERWGKSSL